MQKQQTSAAPAPVASQDESGRRAPGRPRDESCREKVLHAAERLLLTEPLASFSIERVSRDTGVSKATIYRWWPNKSAIAMEAFAGRLLAETVVQDSGGSAAKALTQQLEALRGALAGGLGRVVQSLTASMQHDAELAEQFRQKVVVPRRAAALAIVRRGVEAGELRDDIDPEALLDAVFAPLYLRLLFGYGESNEQLVANLSRLMVKPRER